MVRDYALERAAQRQAHAARVASRLECLRIAAGGLPATGENTDHVVAAARVLEAYVQERGPGE